MPRNVNILLIGETGGGKSTTLNAIVNYLQFNTFEDARSNLPQLKEPVPSNFTLPNEDGSLFIVKSGEDANERSGGGQSATVAPTGYQFQFPFENCILRIFDINGVDTYEENVNLLMITLEPYNQMHGVVFVINGKTKRKTSFFQYCNKFLLSQLHCSIKPNIVFCFTNSQISLGRFGAGSGYEVLEALLKEDIPEVGLQLKRENDDRNCFFVENQCFLMLVAAKRGFKASDLENATSALSWNHSVNEVKAMLSRILVLPPHDLQQTITINNAKRLIRQVLPPVFELSDDLNQKMRQAKEYQQNKPMYDVEIRARKIPVLHCTAPNCIELVVHNGEEKCVFKTKCCDPCGNILLWNGTVGEFGIEWCKAMKRDGTCSNCGCPASVHRRDGYDYIKVDLLSKLNQTIEEIKAEMCQVEKIIAQLDYFISEQSLMRNDSESIKLIDKGITTLLEETRINFDDALTIRYSIKENQMKRLAELVASIRSGKEKPINGEDIPELQQQLLALKHGGPFLVPFDPMLLSHLLQEFSRPVRRRTIRRKQQGVSSQ